MEKIEMSARTNGYTTSFDCGAVRVHIFDEDYLTANTSSEKGNSLSCNIFFDDETPSVLGSELEITAENENQPKTIVGFVRFDVPASFTNSGNTADTITTSMIEYFENTIDGVSSDYERRGNSLVIQTPTDDIITINLVVEDELNAYFEVSTNLDTDILPEFEYERIVATTVIWARLHDFLTQACPLPYHQNATQEMFIGDTPQTTMSNIECTIESRLGLYALIEKSKPPLEWNDKIESDRLSKIEQVEGVPSSLEVAEELLNSKLLQGSRDGKPLSITQYDILKQLHLARERRLQAPDDDHLYD